jgi:outer membrane protein OmpA-like peptidoglycan-associated protein
MKATVAGETMESPLDFVTVVAPPLQIDVTRDDLDLSKGTLRFRASRKVSSAELRVIGIGGEVLSKAEHDVSAANAKENVTLSYRPVPAQDLLRLELRVEDEDGFFRALSLTPWSVHIPHEEVLFATDSAKIRQSEVPKLKDSLQQIITARQRYAQIQGVQLFIAGHTDTRGSSSHNRELSRRRAQAIAAWFVTQGVKLKVFYEGFGESSLKVKTQDEVDEPQNRRVDYILSIEKPALSGGAWRALN